MAISTYIVDLNTERSRRNFAPISEFLTKKINENLEQKKQTLLFLNKRGFASTLMCRDCGEVHMCTHCDVSTTYHKHYSKNTPFLICHACGTMYDVPSTCTSCTRTELRTIGTGTQQIESYIRNTFPHARVARMDLDTMGAKDAHRDMQEQIAKGEVDIILGTQMLTKGLDFPNISLVGIVLADTTLYLPDFRASERMYQLLTQVTGRAGRRGEDAKIVIQTHNPNHPIIQYAANSDYTGMYETILSERRAHNYPPFSKLVRLTYVHRDKSHAYATAKKQFETFKKIIPKDIECYFTPSLTLKQYDKFHYGILLKGKEPQAFIASQSLPSGWRIDVDPVSIM